MLRYIYILCGTLLVSTLVSLFTHSFSLLVWINTLFNFSLLLTIIGAAMLVIQGGFFNAIIRSFRTFFRKINPMNHVLEEIEGKKQESTSCPLTSFSLTIPLVYSGFALLLFSVIFSWYIY